MECLVTDGVEAALALEVVAPERQRLPLVLASPHSGRRYSSDFLAASRLDALTLRKSEDGYVDEIFTPGTDRGAPLLKALFPRAFLDTNREAFELDPEMFADALPTYVNTRSPRVAAGLGTIAKVVAHGMEIYRRKLRFAEALARVNHFYHPYHAALRQLIDETRRHFGYCLLVDCHSMPSAGGPGDCSGHGGPVDFVLGDCHGCACAPVVTDTAEAWLRAFGYTTARNTPYAGGYTTRHYGRPRNAIHTLQIEINRSIYMNEAEMTRKPYLATLSLQMAELVDALGRIDLRSLRFD